MQRTSQYPRAGAPKVRLKTRLRLLNLEVTRPGGRLTPYRLRTVRLPGPHAATRRGALLRPISVALERVTTPFGFSCAHDGWHPYVATLQQYKKDPLLRYEDSALYRLYESFQPRSLQEAILGPGSPPVPLINGLPPELAWNLWSLSHSQLKAAQAGIQVSNRADLLYCGPVDHDRVGRRHFRRLVDVYESIRERGYRPELFADGYVVGHFLAAQDTYGFLVLEGHHRVAALRALGHEKIQVMLWDGVSCVWKHELGRWTTEQGGVLPRPAAELILERLLNEGGRGKGARLGLL